MKDRQGQLVASLETRIRLFTEDGDRSAVLDPSALEEAELLWSEVRPAEGIELGVFHVLGWMHWHRYVLKQADSSQDESDDLLKALNFFQTVNSVDPSLVPESVRQAFAKVASDEPAVTEGAADESLALFRRAQELASQYQNTFDLETIGAAIGLLQRALESIRPHHPNRSTFLLTLSGFFLMRYTQTESINDLNWSIDANREGMDSARAHDATLASNFAGLGFSLRIRFLRTGKMADLEDAVTAGLQAVQVSSPHDPNRGRWLCQLGDAYRLRFERSSRIEDLNDSVDAYARAAADTPATHPDRAEFLSMSARALGSRFSQSGDMADLERGIVAAREALSSAAPPDARRSGYLALMGAGLQVRFRQSGVIADLNEAIELHRTAARTALPEDNERSSYSLQLAAALLTRAKWNGELADVQEALVAIEAVRTVTIAGSPDRLICLRRLAEAWQCRFELSDALPDIDKAAEAARLALELAPEGHPERAALLSLLAGLLRDRFGRSGEISDIDDAIEAIRAAVTAVPSGHQASADYLSKLGIALATRFARTAVMADLQEAIAAAQAAVTSTPPTDPGLPACLSALGNMLETRFYWTGELPDIDQAVEMSRQALNTRSLTPPVRGMYLSNLGIKLGTLYSRTGDRAYLEESVKVLREAVIAIPTDHPARPKYLSNLAHAIEERFSKDWDPADLDEAINIYRSAADATPEKHPLRPVYLTGLGSALLARSERVGSVGDIEEAIAVTRIAADSLPLDDPRRARALVTFAGALLSKSQASEHESDLNEEINACRAAVTATPSDHPYRSVALAQLGNALAHRHNRSAQAADLDEVLACWREAVNHTKDPADRLQAAVRWGRAAAFAGLHEEAFEGFRIAVASLPSLVWRGLDRAVQEERLEDLTGMITAAAALAIEAGHLTEAVELLEQGRSVMWNQALHTRSDLSRLAEIDPNLARELEESAAVLNQGIVLPPAADSNSGTIGLYADSESGAAKTRYRRANEQWERLVARTRQVPGFEQFLLPTPFRDLKKAAADGPVIMINVSQYRCDALIITTAGVQLIPLPDMTYDETGQRFNAMLEALSQATLRPLMFGAANDTVTSVLNWLWRTVVDPVRHALAKSCAEYGQITGKDELPRVWWCPTGPAAVFPFHAAIAPDGTCALEHMISSYTPTLQALLRSRVPRTNADFSHSRLLAVGMPETPGMSPLPNVKAELQTLAQHIPIDLKILPPEATTARVLEEITAHPLVHLSCHGNGEQKISKENAGDNRLTVLDSVVKQVGRSDAVPPAFHLVDGPLTLMRIADLDVRGELAYLSACNTATPSGRLADEAVHLASAMQFAGYRHVIGSLWWLSDELAPQVANTVYSVLANHGRDPNASAIALHAASCELRTKFSSQPARWAGYIHLGP
jgi:tetratricopeptide (TPR) repeat protein